MASPVTGTGGMRELEFLFNENFADVWKFVRRRTASAADADDATAEVFATACRRHGELPPASERRLWLFGVARYVLANHRRSLARQSKLNDRLKSLRHDASIDLALPPEDRLLAALSKLSEEDREILILRAWEGLAVTDIAVLLGVTPNAVSLRLTKARRRLAGLIVQTGSDDGGHERGNPAPRKEGRPNDRSHQ
ncbi:MAG TPA: sigma-70 family RNA polymerase sigma factor [Acidimicrobiales bacterium]|nr:sigma-70 family RNA polymerase sigma factor [Acidimicrobiales bacterium]